MEVIITSDYEAMSERAAGLLTEQVRTEPDSVLGLPTGSTPLGLYERMVRAHAEEGLDFAQVRAFLLDEYVDLPPDHEQSLRQFLQEHLFGGLNIPEERVHAPDALAADLTEACGSYEEQVRSAGGLDFTVLGIGRDGHLGFNEPTSSLGGRAQVVALAPETIEDNSRFFDSLSDVPRFAITLGVRTILESTRCMLLASGERKAGAVKACVEGPLCSMVTASALQLHPNAVVILDEEAASLLERGDYYKWAHESRGRISDRL